MEKWIIRLAENVDRPGGPSREDVLRRLERAGFAVRVRRTPMPPGRLISGEASVETAGRVREIDGVENVYPDSQKTAQ